MDSEKTCTMASLVRVLILAITIPLFSCIVLTLSIVYLVPTDGENFQCFQIEMSFDGSSELIKPRFTSRYLELIGVGLFLSSSQLDLGLRQHHS